MRTFEIVVWMKHKHIVIKKLKKGKKKLCSETPMKYLKRKFEESLIFHMTTYNYLQDLNSYGHKFFG